MQRLIKVDGKVRTDINFPAGFMGKWLETLTTALVFMLIRNPNRFAFQMLLPLKKPVNISVWSMMSRDASPSIVFQLKKLKWVNFSNNCNPPLLIFHLISCRSCAHFQYKLCKVKKTQLGAKNVPFLVTHDGRTIRYPDPIIKANDTIQLDIATSKITDHIKFESGNLCFFHATWPSFAHLTNEHNKYRLTKNQSKTCAVWNVCLLCVYQTRNNSTDQKRMSNDFWFSYDRQFVHDYWWQKFGSCRYRRQPWKTSRFIRYRSHKRFARACVRYTIVKRIHHWQRHKGLRIIT